MKNLIVMADFPPVVGGTTIWYYRICELLSSKGYRIFSLGGSGVPPAGVQNLNPEKKGWFLWRIFAFARDLVCEAVAQGGVLGELAAQRLVSVSDISSIASFLVSIRRVCPRIPQEGGVILASHVNINSLFAYLLARRHGKLKLVIREHGGGILEFARRRPALVSFLLGRAEYVNCVSEFIARECRQKGADPARVRVIRSARDIPAAAPVPKDDLVMFCGFLEPRKDPMTFLKSVRELVLHYAIAERLKFLVVGTGSLKTKMESFCRTHHMEQRVTFAGQLPVHKVWDWMKRTKVLVLPSVREPSGAVLTEAMAHRCYCVAAWVGGIPELVTADRGSLFEPGDYRACARLIAEYFEQEQYFVRKVESAYAFVKSQYSFETASEQLNEIVTAAGGYAGQTVVPPGGPGLMGENPCNAFLQN